jgi:hypothetical protein
VLNVSRKQEKGDLLCDDLGTAHPLIKSDAALHINQLLFPVFAIFDRTPNQGK